MRSFEFTELSYAADAGLEKLVTRRTGEKRIGEEFLFRGNDGSWKERRYHVLGISEDSGPKANGGSGGSDKAFSAFIQRFMSVQSNRFLNGCQVAIHGVISALPNVSAEKREAVVNELDIRVAGWVKEVVSSGGIPIVIGGGHNNAYGMLRGASEALGNPLAAVNLDPHADTRDPEGRHSGNPFTYAWKEGFLDDYTVLGLHESYNNEAILDRLSEMKAHISWFESWIDEPSLFAEDVRNACERLKNSPFGIELDLDSIAYMPSSAFSPSGVTMEQARFYIRRTGALRNAAYLHLPEGAPQNSREEMVVGKALTYFVTDFIKSNEKSRP